MPPPESLDLNEYIVNIYQDLVLLELEKVKRKDDGYDFSSPDTFLSREEIEAYVGDDSLLEKLFHKGLLVDYGGNRFRTAHVDLIWRVINLRAFPHMPPRALEFKISYDKEPLSSFNEHKITELFSIRLLGKHRKEALDIVVRALRNVYPGLSHFQLVVLEKLLKLHGPKCIGIVAPTASGKTLTFMIPILVKAVEEAIEGFKRTVAILTYPRKALAKDQIEKLLELVHRVNKELSRRYGKNKYITIGLDYGDIRRNPPREKDEPLLNIKCPEPGCNGILYLSTKGEVYCSKNKNHRIHYIYAYKEKVWTSKPQIYVTNIWTLYHRLMNAKTINTIGKATYVIFDEAHVYTGYLGGHLHYIIKLLKDLLSRNKPIFIYSSATIPCPSEFLEKLSSEKVEIIDYKKITEEYYKNKGVKPRYKLTIRVYLLPNPNQSVETLTEESILLVTLWCHRHNLKAITFIDSIAEISTIYDYISKTILGIRKGREILDHLFEGETPRKTSDNYSWTPLIPIEMLYISKNYIQEWLMKEFKESINIHYGVLPKHMRSNIENKFRSGKYRMLIATSTLELGIDIGDVAVIIQHKLPREAEGFIQRIGRAGRSNECYRISLSFINLQNSPIAALYFFNEKLRNKLERVENLEPLKVSLSSESVLAQHLLSLLLYKYAVSKGANLTISSPHDLNDLLNIIDELGNELNELDKYVKIIGFVNEDNKKIYPKAKKTVQEFITLVKNTIEYAINKKTLIKKDKVIELGDRLEKTYYEIREHISKIEQIIKLIEKHIGKQNVKQLNSMATKVAYEASKLIEKYKNKIYKQLSYLLHGRVEQFINFKHNYNTLSEELNTIISKVDRLIYECIEETYRTIIYLLEYRDYARSLKRYMEMLRERIEDLRDQLINLGEIITKISEQDISLLSKGVPYYARGLLRILKYHSRKMPNTLKILEELSQIMGLLKLSMILEYPSLKIVLR